MGAFVSDRSYAVWKGIAFEYLCYSHHQEVARVLGFGAVNYEVGSWFSKGQGGRKAQVDLLFFRADRVITLCEMKILDTAVGIGVAGDVDKKLAVLPNPKKHTIERVLITASDPTQALADEGYFHRIVKIDELFGD